MLNKYKRMFYMYTKNVQCAWQSIHVLKDKNEKKDYETKIIIERNKGKQSIKKEKEKPKKTMAKTNKTENIMKEIKENQQKTKKKE